MEVFRTVFVSDAEHAVRLTAGMPDRELEGAHTGAALHNHTVGEAVREHHPHLPPKTIPNPSPQKFVDIGEQYLRDPNCDGDQLELRGFLKIWRAFRREEFDLVVEGGYPDVHASMELRIEMSKVKKTAWR